jgi:UDP-N-acetylglucosamine 2-epimerase (non-hydrolysing)
MKKILIVFGTRPEAIKMAPVILEFQKNKNDFELKICVTSQHREMLDQVLLIFDIVPDYDLNIMRSDQDLYALTTNILNGIKTVLDECTPDIVIVQGDTTTAFATSLAAFYKKIPVAHVEAGLRTDNIYSPWPEEINRQVIDRISKFLFAPTEINKVNLINEKIDENKIIITGNTVIDTLKYIVGIISKNVQLKYQLNETIYKAGYNISKDRKIILVTGHRRENFGQGFLDICEALKDIALNNQSIDIVYPVHLNPNVKKPVFKILSEISNIYLINPLEYVPFIYLMNISYFILTDSGGIQEEAPSFGKPVLVMRDTSERSEAIEAGTAKLVGTEKQVIITESKKLLNNPDIYKKMSITHNPYGDGFASNRIVNYLKKYKL